MKQPVIGIIGAAGVAASAELVVRMERIVTDGGAWLDQQHPEVVLYQATQAPSRSMYVEGRGESFVPAYVDAAKRLAAFGAGRIAMCCNTAHAALDELRAATGLHFIDLIGETVDAVARRHAGARRIGIMCSDGTRKAGLYDRGFAALPGVELLYPDDLHQAAVTQGIRNIKRGLHRHGAPDEQPQTLFAQAAEHLAARGAEVVVMACTEIPLALSSDSWTQRPLIDTIDVLARACLREAGAQYVSD